LKKMDSLSQDISSVYHKLDSQTNELKSLMRTIQHENLLIELITAKENYDNYIQKSDTDHYADLLIKDYENDNIRNKVTALRRSIRGYTSASMKSHAHCNRLTDERVWLAALLSKAAFALGAGCVEYGKQKDWDEPKTHRICDTLNSYKNIVEIEEIMIEEINKCTTTFAKDYTKQWLQGNIRTTDIDGTSNKISSMLTEKFPQFSHIVVVYPPLHGFSEHTTNFGVTLFRWKEMNIAVSILPYRDRYQRYHRNSCGSSNKNLNQFLTYREEEIEKDSDLGTYTYTVKRKVQNDKNARDLYDKLKRYGNTRMLVFKGSKRSVRGYPNNIWCEIVYSDIGYTRDTTIVYV